MSPHDIGFDQDHTPRSEYGDCSAAQCKYGSYGRYGTCMVTTEDKCTKDVFPRTENDALSGAETCRLFRKLPITVVSEWGTFGGAMMWFVDRSRYILRVLPVCCSSPISSHYTQYTLPTSRFNPPYSVTNNGIPPTRTVLHRWCQA